MKAIFNSKRCGKGWVNEGLKHGGKLMVILGLIVSLMVIIMTAYTAAYWRKIVPGVKILGMNVGNMSAEMAAKLVDNRLRKQKLEGIRLVAGDQNWIIEPDDVGVSVNIPKTTGQAWMVARKGGWIERLGQAQRSYFEGLDFGLVVEIDESKWEKITAEMAASIDDEEIQPGLRVVGGDKNKEIVLEPGKDGVRLNRKHLREIVLSRWSSISSDQVEMPVEEVVVSKDKDKVEAAIKLGSKLLGKKLKLTVDEDEWAIEEDELVGLISVAQGGVDKDKLQIKVTSFAKEIDREPQNAAFQFVDGKVEEFRPGKDGLRVEQDRLVGSLVDGVMTLAENEEWVVGVSVERMKPAITTEDVNDLGIKELVGKGESTYFHSIPNRVHNVGLAAQRINGVLISPGEIFSFNQALGEVSAATGFKSAYVISGGRTVLGDGGGVCQVSTTLFRAALDVGLPIVERKAHAYRVGYYEQNYPVGIDATVYNPTADLKFKNDTPGYLLIQTVIDEEKRYLSFEIYGTDDGRVVKLTKPKVWGLSSPPPAIYQDDPSLPVGKVVQVDWAASGAKASFDYQVTKNGEVTFEKTFYSNYQPWRSVYLRGVKID